MNFWRRFTGDYGRDTQHLTLEQHGAYTLTLDVCYTTEKPLPLDRSQIYRMIRASSPSEKAATDFVIDQFFKKTRWGYTHKRVLEEIKHAQSRIKASRQNGKAPGAGRPRKNPLGSVEKPSGLSEQNPKKSSPDSRLPDYQTPEKAEAEEATAAAFTTLGYEPFGSKEFRQAWVEEYRTMGNGDFTNAMERTAAICQKNGVKIPKMFFDLKRKVEEAEIHERFRRTPL